MISMDLGKIGSTLDDIHETLRKSEVRKDARSYCHVVTEHSDNGIAHHINCIEIYMSHYEKLRKKSQE